MALSATAQSWPTLPGILPPARWRPVEDLEGLLTPGIYALIDDQEEIVYVGQSGAVQARTDQHRREARKEFSRAICLVCDDPSERLRIEAILILAVRPRYNRGVNVGFAGDGRTYDLTRSAYARASTAQKKRKALAAQQKVSGGVEKRTRRNPKGG